MNERNSDAWELYKLFLDAPGKRKTECSFVFSSSLIMRKHYCHEKLKQCYKVPLIGDN